MNIDEILKILNLNKLIFTWIVGCEIGLYGNDCKKPCDYPFYGANCVFTCRCSKEECHFINGCRKHYLRDNHCSIVDSNNDYCF